MASRLQTQPPNTTVFALSYPAPFTLLVTITRQKRMNSIPTAGHHEGQALWAWYDAEPSLRIAIITGEGPKAFCAGADLIEQGEFAAGRRRAAENIMPPGGFAGISRRVGKKPIIAAVNGFALGGGFEICLNVDMVVASPTATFGLPEAERGIYAGAGGLPRIVRSLSMQMASELALTSRTLTAQEARDLQLVNRISKTRESVVQEAIDLGAKVAALSPDAVVISRAGLREAWETGSVERAFQLTSERLGPELARSENLKIGLAAFAKKEKPVWVPSKM